MSEHAPDYENALTPKEWEDLCNYLEMDLETVLKLSGPELLRKTMARAEERRHARLLLEQNKNRKKNGAGQSRD